jgi:nitrate/nitrite-specific signal transduction histidine kinase
MMGGYGMGTSTMRERADAIGARLTLDSVPGTGTRIIVELSWPPQAPVSTVSTPRAPPAT